MNEDWCSDPEGRPGAMHLVTADRELRARVAATLAAESLALSSAVDDPDQLVLADAGAPAIVILALSGTPARRVATIRSLLERESIRIISCQPAGRAEVRHSILAGASGYVLRDEIEEKLVPALRAVNAGLIVIPVQDRIQAGSPALTAREKQVMAMVVMGCMNCEVAAQLHLAESTVKSHLSSVFVKLGVRSRSEAVELILDPDHGLGRGILAITSDRPSPANGRDAGPRTKLLL
ncbi:MAG: LuxR C-terminal-related transcriptional regulator [Solirubrobacteraceae bacterium]